MCHLLACLDSRSDVVGDNSIRMRLPLGRDLDLISFRDLTATSDTGTRREALWIYNDATIVFIEGVLV